jgi:uncharacterized membrane protein YidH (DUF202 family)
MLNFNEKLWILNFFKQQRRVFFVNLLGLLLSGLRRVEDKAPPAPGDAGGGTTPNGGKELTDTFTQISQYITYFCTFVLVACGILATFYAVYVGFKLASAEEEGKRKEAKNQLIYSIIGVVGILIFATLILELIPLLVSGKFVGTYGAVDTIIESILDKMLFVVHKTLQIIGTCGVVFAVYIGWNLMKAEDESKRKQAKMQMIYTVVALVAVVLINTISQAVIAEMLKPGGMLNK